MGDLRDIGIPEDYEKAKENLKELKEILNT